MPDTTAHNLAIAKKIAGLLSEGALVDVSCLSEKEWGEIVSMAARHGLGPQLYLRLQKLNFLPGIPAELSSRMGRTYYSGVARGARRSTELAALLSYYNLCNIPVIVLKGPHLAELAYKNWALRPMADFDLLVRKEDITQAAEALIELGYTSPVEVSCDAMVRKHYHLTQMRNAHGSVVELHWALEPPENAIRSDIDGIWQRSKHAVIAGVDTRVMSPEDLLLYLCVHAGYHHKFSFGLLALRDIEMVIRVEGERIKWDRLISLSQLWGAERCLALSLHLSRDFFMAVMPISERNKELRFADYEKITEIAISRLLSSMDNSTHVSHDLAKYVVAKGFLTKIRILFSRIFPPADVVAMIYSVNPASKFLYVYYLKRFVYLLRSYGKTLFLLTLNDQQTVLDVQNQEKQDLLLNWLTAK